MYKIKLHSYVAYDGVVALKAKNFVEILSVN